METVLTQMKYHLMQHFIRLHCLPKNKFPMSRIKSYSRVKTILMVTSGELSPVDNLCNQFGNKLNSRHIMAGIYNWLKGLLR